MNVPNTNVLNFPFVMNGRTAIQEVPKSTGKVFIESNTTEITYREVKDELLATALKCLATGIIVSHNHPSGNLLPSKLDKELTDKLKAGCKLLEITLLDHIILAPDNAYFSFVDDGLF